MNEQVQQGGGSDSTGRVIKRCLVTGATGFVGRVLCEQLRQAGIFVRVVVREEQDGPWDEQVVCALEAAADNREALFEGVDTVFYLASIAHSKAAQHLYQSFNVDTCVSFAKAAANAGVGGFVYVSSTKATAEPYDQLVDEAFTEPPLDAYGTSKREAEEQLLALDSFLHLAIVRPCLIYGVGVKSNLDTMMKAIGKGVFPPLPETGARRSMVSVGDVSRALLAVAQSPVAHRQVYIVTDKQDYSVYEITRLIRAAFDKGPFKVTIPFFIFRLIGATGDLIKKIVKPFPVSSDTIHKLLGPARYSSDKLTRDTGWQPQDTFASQLPAMVQVYRQ